MNFPSIKIVDEEVEMLRNFPSRLGSKAYIHFSTKFLQNVHSISNSETCKKSGWSARLSKGEYNVF